MPRFVPDSRPISAQHPIAEFYREEFLKHRRCLQQQRAYYSESAITDVEAALSKIISKLEQLSTQDNAPQLIGSLLKKFDVVTGLSAWSVSKHLPCPFRNPSLEKPSWRRSGRGFGGARPTRSSIVR